MTCDEWENFGHTKTSFGRREIVVDKTRDEWENSGHTQKEIPVKIFLLEILFPVRPTGFWPLEPVDFQLVTQLVKLNGNYSC